MITSTSAGARGSTGTAGTDPVTEHSRSRAPHWPALDGLRGSAVIGVVLYHLGWLPGGFLGVDLFFTLSGFLITSLLIAEAQRTDRIDLVAFWGRRMRRLLPAVLVMVAVVLGWLALWGSPTEQASARIDGAWALPYLANWHLIADAHSYWAPATESSVFVHLWSLAIEEQFYVLWPLVVAGALAWSRRRLGPTRVGRSNGSGLRTLITITALGWAASTIWMFAVDRSGGPTRAYMGTDTRAASLLIGALVAAPPVRDRITRVLASRRGFTAAWSIVLVGLLATLWWLGGRDLDLLFRGGFTLHAAVAALLIVVLTGQSARQSPVAATLSTRILGWFGRRSYGLYLWHWPVIVVVEARLDASTHLTRVAIEIATSVGLAEFSHRLVESPVRIGSGWGRWLSPRAAVAGLVAVSVIAVGLAPTGRGEVAGFDAGALAAPTVPPAPAVPPGSGPVEFDPTPPPTPVPAPPLARRPEPIERTGSSSVEDLPGTESRPLTASVAAMAPIPIDLPGRKILWVGDSIAADAAPAVIAALDAAGTSAADGAFVGRRIVSSDGVDAETLYPELLAEYSPDLVVIQVSLWDSSADTGEQLTAWTWFHELVRSTGADLVIVTAPPVRDDLVVAGTREQSDVVRAVAAADPHHTVVLDADELWGPTIQLDLDGDGVPDRKRDGVHICPQGAARFAGWLVASLDGIVSSIDPAPIQQWAAGDWTTDPTYDTPVGTCAAL